MNHNWRFLPQIIATVVQTCFGKEFNTVIDLFQNRVRFLTRE